MTSESEETKGSTSAADKIKVWLLVFPETCECGRSNEHFRTRKWHLGTLAALLTIVLSILPFCFASPDSEHSAFIVTHDSNQEEVFIGGQQACNGNAV